MNRKIPYKYLNILFFIVTLFVNYLSVVYRIGGVSIRELSDKYDNLFTPAPSTFAIWSLIYLLLIVYVLLPFFNKAADHPLYKSPLFLLSCLFNFSWILAWQYQFLFLSLLIMLALLATLALINGQLKKEKNLFLSLAFGIYLGWICIATVANTTALLVGNGIRFNANTEIGITSGLLAVALLIVSWVMYKLKNPFPALAVCWAFYGVYTKRAADHPVIAQAAIAVLIMLAAWALFLSLLIYRKKALVQSNS